MALSTSSRASGVEGGGGESPSQSRGDHIDITYQQTRSPSTMTAHITDISQLSPTIKGFRYVSLARYVAHGHKLWLINCDDSQHRVWYILSTAPLFGVLKKFLVFWPSLWVSPLIFILKKLPHYVCMRFCPKIVLSVCKKSNLCISHLNFRENY